MLLIVAFALASSSGMTGASTTGCGACHGASASDTTTASFSTETTTVAPGETIDVVFTVSTTTSTRTGAGLDVSATDGDLAAGSNTRLSRGEITHSRAEAMSDSAVEFELTWTAPDEEGTYTLRGAGNAVNRDGNDSNADGWNLADDLTITVDDGCNDADEDGMEDCDGDCDDNDAGVYLGAVETCDDVDEDCDGEIDEDATDSVTWGADADGDGYGAAEGAVTTCDALEGYVANTLDCNDADPLVSPSAEEACDATVDANCDGSIGDADADGDGWVACLDCNDADAAANPEGTEACGGGDEDCDGTVDEAGASGETTWYADADGDGHGDPTSTALGCVAPEGHVATGDDCDDTRDDVRPSAAEVWYDGVDQNCDQNDDDQDEDGIPHTEDCVDTDAAIGSTCPEPEPEDTGDTGGDPQSPPDDDPAACGCGSGLAPGWLMVGLAGWMGRRRGRG